VFGERQDTDAGKKESASENKGEPHEPRLDGLVLKDAGRR